MIPNSIPERLPKNSSNQEIFNTAKVEIHQQQIRKTKIAKAKHNMV